MSFACVAIAQTIKSDDWRYVVRPKDTLFEFSRKYLKKSVSWQDLAKYNQVSDPLKIQSGVELRVPVKWLSVKPAQARLTVISGDVQIQTVDENWYPATQGQWLQSGMLIRVGINSSARIQFADESELIIQPESSVALDTLSMFGGGYMVDTRLRLQAGRVEVHANPNRRKGQKFDVITPAAVASVRGTKFVVEAQNSRTIEQTSQGLVILNNSLGKVEVHEGYGVVATIGVKPQSPEVIKRGPVFKTPTTLFSDFPVTFSVEKQEGVLDWVMQVGHDPEMALLVLTQKGALVDLDASNLPNGRYYLRAWSLDAQGMPSKPSFHEFVVNIPRQLLGPAVQLHPQHYSAGPVMLQLPPLAINKRYFVQVTQDAYGRVPIWYVANAGTSLKVPVPPDPERTHYLWIWLY